MKLLKTILLASVLFVIATSANSKVIDVTTLDQFGETYYSIFNTSSGCSWGALCLSTVNGSAGYQGLTIEQFTGVSDILGVEGSAAKGFIDVLNPQVLTFDWKWSSEEKLTERDRSFYNDYAFVSFSINGESEFITISDLSNMPFDSWAARDFGESGTFSWMVQSTGNLEFSIGVMDVGDNSNASVMEISNMRLSPVSPVPEPSTFFLMASGLGLVGFMASRRRKQA